MYNKHYIRIDSHNNVIKVFSDAFEQPQPGDICIAEEAGRHFELFGQVNPPLMGMDGVHLYHYTGDAVTAKTPEEIEAEAAARVIEFPTTPTFRRNSKSASFCCSV